MNPPHPSVSEVAILHRQIRFFLLLDLNERIWGSNYLNALYWLQVHLGGCLAYDYLPVIVEPCLHLPTDHQESTFKVANQ